MMNAVNRVLVVVMLVIAIPLCTILLVLPVPVLGAVEGQLTALVDSLDILQPLVRVTLGVLLALALDAIFILLIVLEVRRPRQKAIHVKQAAGGEVQIVVTSIADRLEYETNLLAGVLRSKANVSAKRGGVVVELDVETAAGVNVPEKAGQIIGVAQQVVKEKMGLKLARPPKVNLRTVSYPPAPKGRPPALQEDWPGDARPRVGPDEGQGD
ncbi:MAG: hypothetical protein SWK90_01625 [Chloroflexota bacterium]|nr:hypothetical protein [Chloroflexota bacterium]